MKIFASSLLAALATAHGIHPDFFAGFIYGMTDSNDLVEMKLCMDDTHQLAAEADRMIHDLENGDIAKAALLFKKLKKELPEAMTACKSMDEDMATVNDWFSAWSDPTAVIKEATLNYVKHQDQVKADRKSEMDHSAAGQYFHAGEDFARVMTDLLPMTPHVPAFLQ